MSQRVDIKAIAKRTGYSVGTVSMALNDSPLIKASTREKIAKVASDMGYVPSIIAQVVSQRHSQSVGIIVPNSIPYFFGNIVHGVMNTFEAHGQRAFVVYSQDSPESEVYYLKIFQQLRVRGLLFAPCPATQAEPYIKALQEAGTGIVYFDRGLDGVPSDFVGVDYIKAAEIAAERLLDAGHERIGVLVGDPPFSSTLERTLGLKRALKKRGMTLGSGFTLKMDYESITSREEVHGRNRERFARFLQRKQPTALFLAMDGNLGLVVRYCEDTGIKIPEELNLVCFDHPVPARPRKSNYVHVISPVQEIGHAVGRVMVDRLREPKSARQRNTLEAEVWPETTCGPRTNDLVIT